LGQKEAFKNIENLPLADNHPKLVETHKQTALFINNFRAGFKNFFNAYTAEREPSVKIEPAKMEQFKAMQKSNLNLQSFSDCIQAYTCLHTTDYHACAINGIFGMFISCGGMLLLSLSLGKPFRAGIEVDWGTVLENGEVYGPVMYKAYELENKIAEYPRIVIGPEILNYLGNLKNGIPQFSGQEQIDIEYCKNLANKCSKMVIRDIDGVLILDYLSKEFIDSIIHGSKDDVDYKDMFNKALQFVESEYKKRKQMNDRKLALRYYMLLNYLKVNNPFNKPTST